VHEESVGDAAAVSLTFPATERGVAREGPSPGVVVEVLWAAEVVEGGKVLLEVVGDVVEELVLVDRTVRPSALAPLSEISMISVLSSWPMSCR
jgi:hypothetical protein